MITKSSFTKVDISQLKLDPENPRLPESLKRGTDKDIINWMLSDATLIDLIASISENGFFQGEPIIVLHEDGKYLVIEGNRRLAAVKLLLNPSLAKTNQKSVNLLAEEASKAGNIPSELWVYVVRDRKEVENYLGFRHVTGVKQWPLISKARYLNHLFTINYSNSNKIADDSDVYKKLAKEIGSKATYVRRLLMGYNVFEIIRSKKYYSIPDLAEENFDLSLITDAITMYSAISEFVGVDIESDKPFGKINQERLKELTHWLYEKLSNGKTKVGDNRNLRVLNKIIQNQDARESFVKGEKSLTEASEITDLADENIRLYLNKSLKNLIEAQKLIHRSTNPDNQDKELVDEILESAELIRRTMVKKMRDVGE